MTAKKLLFKNSRSLKYFIFRLTCVVFAVMITSCEQNPTAPNEPPKSPGYQEDIYWSSLADSPWPMNHHDPQSTGRSKYLGPQNGEIVDSIYAFNLESGIVIGVDSTIYFISTLPSKLISANYKGEINWELSLGNESTTTPIVTKDNNIIVAKSSLGKITSLKSDGSFNWEFNNANEIWSVGLSIGLDGSIYFIDVESNLVSLNPSGEENWRYQDGRFLSTNNAALTVSPDGKTLYIQGNQESLFAFDIEKKEIKWNFTSGNLISSPIVDYEGNLYLVPLPALNNETDFICLKSDGIIKWKFTYATTNYSIGNIEPAIDQLGNIIFGFDTLYSLNYTGELNWKIGLSDNEFVTSPIICDVNGNVFIGTDNNSIPVVYCYSSLGYKNWEVSLPGERATGLSPALSQNGLLFVPTFRSNYIYIIK